MGLYGKTLVEFLEGRVSDHSTSIISEGKLSSFGPRPFKFFSFWADHPKFLQWVEEGWQGEVTGVPMFQFCSKLKDVKQVLKLRTVECLSLFIKNCSWLGREWRRLKVMSFLQGVILIVFSLRRSVCMSFCLSAVLKNHTLSRNPVINGCNWGIRIMPSFIAWLKLDPLKTLFIFYGMIMVRKWRKRQRLKRLLWPIIKNS